MVLLELMEGDDKIGETDEEKVQRVELATGYQGDIDTTTCEIVSDSRILPRNNRSL